jgi:motility quorum-sensing regulator/GCU-specific mRNA interferase toxin
VDKRRPHCPLPVVKSLVEAGKVRSTLSALRGAAALGIVGVVMALTADDCHKSMTTYSDHRVWQDVYRPQTPMGEVYLKLTVIDDVLIVSFKEL